MVDFIRINGEQLDPCYMVDVRDGVVYYGHNIPGHQNKAATACMTIEHYNKLHKAGRIIGKEIAA